MTQPMPLQESIGLPRVAVDRYQLEFTGSGSEYFRIWIVNLLLMVLTAGLYYPWARVRKLKYFYSNTRVAGHALDFHGNPRQMLKGFLLMVVFFIVYSGAGKVSELAGSVASLALAALWPALMRASLQFRLANTSWRGLRFEFKGSLKDAYLVFGKPFAAMVGLGVLGGVLLAIPETLTRVLGGLALLGIYGVLPYMYYSFKRYQHDHYAFAQLQTSLRASFPDVLKVFMKTGGVAALVLFGGLTLMALLIGGSLLSGLGGGGSPAEGAKAVARLLPLLVILVVLMQFVPLPYFQSQMQNLLWSNTGSRLVRFKSKLAFTALFKQTVLNWALTLLTLGLYWPFAQIALTRLKVQAISVHVRVDPDTLTARLQRAGQAGVGDAALDIAGIDLGL